MNMGNLYVIRATDTGYYKIGVTSRSVEDRLKELQTGNHVRLEVVRCYEFGNVEKVEKKLHEHFLDRRISGEWFDLPNAGTVDAALSRLGVISYNLLSGNILKQTKVKSASDRFDFAKETLCNKDMGNFGRLMMFLWSLFVPLEPVIESIAMAHDDFHQFAAYDDDNDPGYQEYD